MTGLRNILKNSLFRMENTTCALCGRDLFDEEYICKDCREKLPEQTETFCIKCGRKTGEEGVCLSCKARMPKTKTCRSAYVYDGEVKRIIRLFKDDYFSLSGFIADEMDKVFLREFSFEKFDAVAYVPMTDRAVRARGYNQTKLLAEILSEKWGIPVLEGLIKKTDTPDQKRLSASDRRKNLEGAFAFKGKAKERIILIDDVLTTGSTSDAIAVALKKKGAKNVSLLTFAAVEEKEYLKKKGVKEKKTRKNT